MGEVERKKLKSKLVLAVVLSVVGVIVGFSIAGLAGGAGVGVFIAAASLLLLGVFGWMLIQYEVASGRSGR